MKRSKSIGVLLALPVLLAGCEEPRFKTCNSTDPFQMDSEDSSCKNAMVYKDPESSQPSQQAQTGHSSIFFFPGMYGGGQVGGSTSTNFTNGSIAPTYKSITSIPSPSAAIARGGFGSVGSAHISAVS